MAKVIDIKLTPELLSFGRVILKVNKIVYVEKMDSKLYKSNLNLGTVQVPAFTEEGNPFFLPKEEVYRLESLYRCIIDTGVVLDSELNHLDYTVESLPSLVMQKGIVALTPVKYNDGEIVKLGVGIVNLSSMKVDITKYMKFAVLVTRKESFETIEFNG